MENEKTNNNNKQKTNQLSIFYMNLFADKLCIANQLSVDGW